MTRLLTLSGTHLMGRPLLPITSFLRATRGHSTWCCDTGFVANTKNILAPLEGLRENWIFVKIDLIESRDDDVRACMHRDTASNSEKLAFRNWTTYTGYLLLLLLIVQQRESIVRLRIQTMLLP